VVATVLEFYVREKSTGAVYKVLHILRENDKTFFLVWYDEKYFRYIDARKTEYIDDDVTWG